MCECIVVCIHACLQMRMCCFIVVLSLAHFRVKSETRDATKKVTWTGATRLDQDYPEDSPWRIRGDLHMPAGQIREPSSTKFGPQVSINFG